MVLEALGGPGGLARGAAAVGLLALAILLLGLQPGHRASRVFAYLLLLMAVRDFPAAYALAIAGPFVAGGWGHAEVYLLAAIPFGMAYFAAVYPRPRTWIGSTRWGPWAVLAVLLAVETAYFLDHGLYRGLPPAQRTAGPLLVLETLTHAIAGCVAVVLARDAARTQPGPERASILLVSLGFALLPAYSGARVLLYHAFGLEALPPGSGLLDHLRIVPHYVTWPLALAPCALLAALLARQARGGADAELRSLGRRALAVLALGPAAAALVVAIYLLAPGAIRDVSGFFPGTFSLALPGLVAYGLLRYRVFDLDLKVKLAIRQGTVVTGFAGAALLGSQLAARWLPPEESLAVSVLATGLLVLALARIQRLADRVADAALPAVRDDPAYLTERKVQVYRAALERAYDDQGSLDPRGAAMLASLRAELGLSDRDHALLDVAVRTRGAAPGQGALVPGTVVLGKYRVERPLGEGAHGATYLAHDLVLGRRVALKALRAPAGGSEDALREARGLSALRHPHVVTVYDADRVGERVFLVLEYLDGGSLRDRLAGGALDPAAFRTVARGLLAALGAVHEAGIVHRDVKPGNVLLTTAGEAKLADFGIAHLPGLETTVGGSGGAALGTVRFMSPEQAKGKRVTARSDLFSAAATLYEASTGKPYLEPAPGESAVELQLRAATAGPFRGEVEGQPALQAWFARALHPSPERRFPSAAAMAAALEAALGGGPALTPG